jgi:predicted amidohydrolase
LQRHVRQVIERRKGGVTTSIDAGSAGPGNFTGFRKHVIEPSQVRILAYIHVSHAGIFGFSRNVSVGESEDLRLMDPAGAVEIAAANSDLIVGIKVLRMVPSLLAGGLAWTWVVGQGQQVHH